MLNESRLQFSQFMDQLCRLDRNNVSIEMQLLSSNQTLLISVYDSAVEKALLFEEQFSYLQLKKDHELICNTWQQFCQSLKYLIQHSPQSIAFESDGKIVCTYSVSVLGNSLQREITFPLKRRLEYQDQVRILRQKVQSYDREVQELRKQLAQLKVENSEISARIGCLEQLALHKGNSQQPHQSEQSAPIAKQQITQTTVKIEEQSPKAEKVQESENVQLTLDIDPNALYLCKFKIEDNKITSLYEDYFQVCWKDPLPRRGIAKAFIKMTAKNHFSLGIMGESERNNQYSFQNNNSVCLYTYYQGFFRGLYVRGKYFPLEWSINVNEVIEIEIDTRKGTMTFGLAKSKHGQEIDISDLINDQRLYFFFETYEKDNSLVFLKEQL